MAYNEWVARETDHIELQDMKTHLRHCKHLSKFKKGCIIRVRDRIQDYEYKLECTPARTVADLQTTYTLKNGELRSFCPSMLPSDILACGVFSGRYLNDCMNEFPREWFEAAINNKVLDPFVKGKASRPEYNCYNVHSSQSRRLWIQNGWMHGDDPRGWFQWFFRYALGRREPEVDSIQMRRWGSYKRHFSRLTKARKSSPKTQQGLLQWAWPHSV